MIGSKELADKIICTTVMISGGKEVKEVGTSNARIYSLLRCRKDCFIVPGAKHDISDKKYQKKIEEVINLL